MKQCSIEGCEREAYSKTYCTKHYGRDYRHGDPMMVKKRGRPSRNCTIAGCGKTHYSNGHCKMHYERVRRTGSTELQGRRKR